MEISQAAASYNLTEYVRQCFSFEANEDGEVQANDSRPLNLFTPEDLFSLKRENSIFSQNKDFISLMTNIFLSYVEDSNDRLKKAKNLSHEGIKIMDGTGALLGGGMWDRVEYYLALKKFKEDSRLEEMVKEGSFYHGYLSKHHFKLIPDPSSPTLQRLDSFVLKKGIKPSEALQSLENDVCLVDSKIVCDIAACKALDHLLQSKFDALFKEIFQYSIDKSSIQPIFKTVYISSEREIETGDLVHFFNVNPYISKHPLGMSKAITVLCCAKNPHKYLCLGMPSEGATCHDIEKKLWQDLNSLPVDEGILDETGWKRYHQKFFVRNEAINRSFLDLIKKYKISWKDFQNQGTMLHARRLPAEGKRSLHVLRPDIEFIQQLAGAPLDEIQKIFSKKNDSGRRC